MWEPESYVRMQMQSTEGDWERKKEQEVPRRLKVRRTGRRDREGWERKEEC